MQGRVKALKQRDLAVFDRFLPKLSRPQTLTTPTVGLADAPPQTGQQLATRSSSRGQKPPAPGDLCIPAARTVETKSRPEAARIANDRVVLEQAARMTATTRERAATQQ